MTGLVVRYEVMEISWLLSGENLKNSCDSDFTNSHAVHVHNAIYSELNSCAILREFQVCTHQTE